MNHGCLRGQNESLQGAASSRGARKGNLGFIIKVEVEQKTREVGAGGAEELQRPGPRPKSS